MYLESSKASQHEANHRQVDHGFAGQSLAFVVPAEPAGTAQPTESALHYPSSRQYFEGMQIGTLHDLDCAVPQLACPLHQASLITSIGPDVFDLSARLLREESIQQSLASIAILDVGRQDHHLEKQADGIDQDMPLASIDLLARVVTPLVAGFGTLYALAVDDSSAGLGLASLYQAKLLPQMSVYLLPQTVVLPQPEVMVDGAPGRKVLRQIAPLTAGLDDIEDPVEQLAEGMFASPTLLAGLGKTIVDELPFVVSYIRCVSHRERITDCGTRYKLTLK